MHARVVCGGLSYPCEFTLGTRSLAPGSGRCSKGSSTTFPRLAVVGNLPEALAMVCCSTYVGSVFNSWEGQSRHRSRDPTRCPCGVWLWRDWDAESLLPSWLGTGRPFEFWKRSRPPVSSHRVTVTRSQGSPASLHTCLAAWSNCASAEDGPEISDPLLHAQEGVGHCLFFHILDELQSYLGVGHVALSKLALTTKLKPDGSAADLGPSSVGRQLHKVPPLLGRLCCLGRKTRWKTASTSSWFTAPWSGSSWTWPTHPTTYRSVRLSDRGTRFLVFKVLGMGGKSSPNIWGQFAAAIGRVVLSVSSGRFALLPALALRHLFEEVERETGQKEQGRWL